MRLVANEITQFRHTTMMHLKLQSRGRGRDDSIARGLVESTLDFVYRRDWPGHLWGLTERAHHVRVVRAQVEVAERSFHADLEALKFHFGPGRRQISRRRAEYLRQKWLE